MKSSGELFELAKQELTEDWRKLRNEELHDLYFSLNVIRIMEDEMGGA